jgi:hypothetical protein
MVVIAIIAVAAVAYADKMTRENQDRHAKLAADNISVLGVALTLYMQKNTPDIVAVVSNAPYYIDVTPAQLLATGDLSANFNTALPWGGSYNMRIWRAGAAAPYTLSGMVMSTTAWKISGKNRIDLARKAALKIGGAGGWTELQATKPGPIGVGWTSPPSTYPLTGMTPSVYDSQGGQLFFLAGPTSIYDATYLRLDGTNTMRGQLNMGDNPINSATDITASGTVTGGTLVSKGEVTAEGNITTKDKVIATNDVEITSIPTRGFINETPQVTSVKRLMPKLVELTNTIVEADGQTVNVPDCGVGGTPAVFILPHKGTGMAEDGLWGADVRMTGPVGGVWSVVAKDPQGNGIGVDSTTIPVGNWAAIVRAFCEY